MNTIRQDNKECHIFIVESPFRGFKKGDVFHQWGKHWTIIAATPTKKQVYTSNFYYSVLQNVSNFRLLNKNEIIRITPHLNYLGKRLANNLLILIEKSH